MKSHIATAIFISVLLAAATLFARDPKPFARSAEVKRPLPEVEKSIKNYFASDSLHHFEIVEAAKNTLTARRPGIDQKTWGEWAYCKVGPLNMMDTLDDATATVKVALDRETKSRTFVSVTPVFEAEYHGLTGSKNIVSCTSLGVLEKDILTAAGATPEELGD